MTDVGNDPGARDLGGAPGVRPDTPEVQERVRGGLGGTEYKEYQNNQYVELVEADVPGDLWSRVFFSWMSMKGHVQGLHDLQRTEMFATRMPDESVHAVFITIWNFASALAEYLQNGYPVERMLLTVGVPSARVKTLLMRDYS